MTQEELERLKDVTALGCAIYQDEQDGVVEDVYGVWWLTGQLNGEAVKRRLHGASLSSYSPLTVPADP